MAGMKLCLNMANIPSKYPGIMVGGIPTPLKNIKVSWDDEIPNILKNEKCSKPPTSIYVVTPFLAPIEYIFGITTLPKQIQQQKNAPKRSVYTSWLFESQTITSFLQHIHVQFNGI